MSAYLQNLNIQKPQLNERVQTLMADGSIRGLGTMYAPNIVLTSTADQIQFNTTSTQDVIWSIETPAVGYTANTYDPGAGTQIRYGIDYVVNFAATTASQSLIIQQSGATCYLPRCTVATTITLPNPFKGGYYDVYLTGTPDGSHVVTFDTAAGTNLFGSHIGNSTAVLVSTPFSSASNLILGDTTANANIGNFIKFRSDGTKWIINAFSDGTADAFTTS